MSLDDRLRGAYQRQLDDVEARVESRTLHGRTGSSPDEPLSSSVAVTDSGRRRLAPVLAAAAVAVVAMAGTLALSGRWDQTDTVISTDSATDDGSRSTANQSTVTSTSSSAPAPSPTAPSSTAAPTTASPSTAPNTSAPASSGPPTSVSGSGVTQPPAVDGIPTAVCPSGLRAELETASTSYLSEEQGWNRKHNLIDEQDGPYYFQAWEPNYPGSVIVEVTLADPVLAADIRVFQDPFTAVSGAVSVEALAVTGEERRFQIELSGVDGWRIHAFDEPLLLDRFVISRNQAESNIMEVMVCLA